MFYRILFFIHSLYHRCVMWYTMKMGKNREKETAMYQFNSRIRYSETDETGRLSVPGIINYMQDCSTFQSEDRHAGVDFLTGRNRAWLLSSWRILIDRYPRLGEEIAVGTWHCGTKGIYGYRNFVLLDQAQQPLVRALSLWFLYDTEKNMPARIQPEDMLPYGEPESPLDLGEVPKKIRIPEEYDTASAVIIGRHHLDTNHHVNNAQYVEIAKDALPPGLRIREIRADYKRAALLGDTVIPRISCSGSGQWTVALVNETGELFAAVWLQG